MKTDILEQFRKLEFLFRRYVGGRNRRGEGGDPHRGQGRILSILKIQPEISQRELGYLLDMRKQSLGELLGKLELKEYITREPSEDDRRVMQIRLTEQGVQAAQSLSEEKCEREDILAVLTDEEQEALAGYLKKLIDELESKVGPNPENMEFRSGPHRGDCKGRGPGHGGGRGEGQGGGRGGQGGRERRRGDCCGQGQGHGHHGHGHGHEHGHGHGRGGGCCGRSED